MLLLRDVLGFDASETAEVLDTSVASVTSALQRGRQTIEARVPRQSQQAELTTRTGSCVCGAIQFECDIDLAAGTTRCNCSSCAKQRYWMVLAPIADFRIVRGEDSLLDYQRTPPSRPEPFLHFLFCRTCGARPFVRGGALPMMGGEFYAVNVACLDGLSDAELAAIPVSFVDGRHDRWGRTPSETRYL